MAKLGLFSTYIRTTPRLLATEPIKLAGYAFRIYSPEEAGALYEHLRRRSVFARHRQEDFYASRTHGLAGASVLMIDAPNWGGGRLPADEARARAERVERLLLLVASYSMRRVRLHARLGLDPSRAGGVDLHMDATLSRLSTRTRRQRTEAPVEIDGATGRRLRDLGVEATAPGLIANGTQTMQRANRALSWLEESRIEPHPQAAIIKTAIGFETLLVFDSSEPLRKSIGERLAFLLGRDAAQRALLSSAFARFYDVRSAIAHGGHRKVQPSQVLDRMDRLLFLTSMALASNAEARPTDDSVRDWFEQIRWGSEPIPTIPFSRSTIDRALWLSASAQKAVGGGGRPQ